MDFVGGGWKVVVMNSCKHQNTWKVSHGYTRHSAENLFPVFLSWCTDHSSNPSNDWSGGREFIRHYCAL